MFGADKTLQATLDRLINDVNALKGKSLLDIKAGTNITINKRNPRKPIISSTAAGGGGAVTGTPEQIAYFDGDGNVTSDAGLKRDTTGTVMKVEEGKGVYAMSGTSYLDSDYFEASFDIDSINKGKVVNLSKDFGEEPEVISGLTGFQIAKSSTGLGMIQYTSIGDKRQEIGFELGNSQVPKIKIADYEDYNDGTDSIGVEITFSEGTFRIFPHEDATSGDMVQIYNKSNQMVFCITKDGAIKMESLPNYADDAAATADALFATGSLYTVTGSATIHVKQ